MGLDLEEKKKERKCLIDQLSLWFIGFVCVGLIPLLLCFPFDWEEKSVLRPGETFTVKNYDPYWYKSIGLSTDASEGNQNLLYFNKCPERLNVTRSKKFNTHIQQCQTFHLTKGSKVYVTWQSSLDVNFVITMGDSSSPIFETEAIDNQKDFKYTVSSTEYYSFCWKTKQKELLGYARFRFYLATYDSSIADEICSLTKDNVCKFNYKQDSCIVMDYYNLDSNETIQNTIQPEGDREKYFRTRVVPYLVVCFMFMIFWMMSLVLYHFTSSQWSEESSPIAETEDEGGQTEDEGEGGEEGQTEVKVRPVLSESGDAENDSSEANRAA